MKKNIFVLLLCLYQLQTGAQTTWSAVSPDKNLKITLSEIKGELFYKVLYADDIAINNSRIGIKSVEGDFTNNFSYIKSSATNITDDYTLKIGKRKVNHAVAGQMSVTFKNQQNTLIRIDLRAYNDGVAFRCYFPESNKTITVTDELTSFSIPPDGKTWLQAYDKPSEFGPSYEGIYHGAMAIGTNARDDGGWAYPALFNTGKLWLLVTEAGLDKNYFGTHLAQDCQNGVYKIAVPNAGEGLGTGKNTATAVTPFGTPWRVIIAGKSPGTIVESNLVYHVSEPNKISDDSWIKPGRSSWSWWSDHASSTDFSKLKRYVDLSKDMGWEYSLVDANWNIMGGGGNIEELVKYAVSKNVGLTLWYNSGGPHTKITERPRDIMIDPEKRKAEFKKLRAMGVKGIKVDFFVSDKQNLIQLYLDILSDAAAEHIVVDFHGCTLPRGWSRTYPNLLTMEGVRGAENYCWSKEYADQAPEQNNILIYTRNVVGPMDYTPVTFTNYSCCPHTTTYAHELATTVLFESGLFHLADKDSSYQSLSDTVKNFLRNVPVTWDDTKFIRGEPGKETILARRSGNTWYIAGSNGELVQKAMNFKLPFLKTTNYKADIFADGSTASEIKTSTKTVGSNQAITINVLPKGGFIVVLSPIVK